MNDDLFIEDVLDDLNKKKAKKKKIKPKDKGHRGERDLCQTLSERFPGKSFFRTVGSGNRWSQVDLTEEAKQILTSDVTCPGNFLWSVECKYGYDNIDLCSAFNGHKELDKFIEQAEKDAGRVNKKPLLCWRKTGKNWLAFIKTTDCPDLTYRFHYRDWVGVLLSELFKQPDSFFFKST